MYNITVPVVLDTLDRYGYEASLAQFKRIGVARILIAIESHAIETYVANNELANSTFESLKRACAFFKSEGYEVGAWIWTFMYKAKNSFTKIESPTGAISPDEICPTDPDFRRYMAGFVKQLAECGVDIILFDDDYRLGYFDNVKIGCTCPNHMKMINEFTKSDKTSADIEHHLLSGKKNKYRKAFVRANRKSLLDFAAEMRASVDSVNPDIRLGVCACITSWHSDGADPVTLSRALAGKTKPLLRLIGAPYWAATKAWGSRIADVIELERMERSWCDDDIEIISEGDTYPRPRYVTPASYLEGFDTALRADGRLSGILRYMIDYTASPDYESGYIDRYIKNKALYDKIDKHFSDKECVGIRLYEYMKMYDRIPVPENLIKNGDFADIFFAPSSRIFSACSIPTKYTGKGVGVAFGDNVRFLPQRAFKYGLILDIEAARIISKNGTDVGIDKFGSVIYPTIEEYKNGQRISCDQPWALDIKTKEKAIIVSYYSIRDKKIPASFFYQNESGNKFFILNFDTYNSLRKEKFFRNYARSAWLAKAYEMLGGSKLPAYCHGNPDLYTMTKKNTDATALAVGLWNFFADSIEDAKICLDTTYSAIEFINCTGSLDGDIVTITNIPAYGFVGFEVKK